LDLSVIAELASIMKEEAADTIRLDLSVRHYLARRYTAYAVS
jgi:hypothetical protein